MWRVALGTCLLLAGCGGESPTAPRVPSANTALAALPVQITTSGVDPGTTSFDVLLDNLAARQAAVNGTTTFRVTPGRHFVRLHQLPRHCQISVAGILITEFFWERTLEVLTPDPAGFRVECFLTGTLRLELQTSGSHAPSLYIGLLSNHPDWLLELPINGSLTVRDVRSGPHQLSISTGPNCVVSDPRLSSRLTIDLVPAETVTVRIPITCS